MSKYSATSKYLEFVETKDTGKTKAFNVISTRGGALLATISWYGTWRQYVMFPARLTVWNPECLRAIIEFIEGLMEERRAACR